MSSARRQRQDRQPYLELAAQGRADDIVDLYAEDATVEDPVGGEVHIGREAIRGFYDDPCETTTPNRRCSHCGPRPGGGFYWALTVEVGGNRMRIEIISTMTFNDDGKIASMKAYWGPENVISARNRR